MIPSADSAATPPPIVDAPLVSEEAFSGQPTVRTGIAVAAMILMLGNILSRMLGLFREQLASGLFGTGDPIAAFTIADNVNTLIFDLVISGMLEAALIPVLAQWATPSFANRDELRRVSGALLTLAAIVIGACVFVGILFAPTIVKLMTSYGTDDSAHDPSTVSLTVTLVRWILPAVFFLGIGTILMSVLFALNRVTAPAMSAAVRNGVIVLAMILLHERLGVKSMVVGIVAGAVLLASMQSLALLRAGALPIPNLHFRHPGVTRVLALYVPIFLGLFIDTVKVIVDRNLAWGAERDALGAMRYATTLVQMVLGIVAAAISLAALPTLSRHFAEGNEAGFRDTLGRALGMVTVLIVPAVLGLAAVAKPTVDLLFHHGATGGTGAHLIVVALLGYLPGTLCAAYDQILIFGFYARQNTRTPVIVGIIATCVYFAIALTFVNSLGMLGLVFANSAQFAAHVAIMIWLWRRSMTGFGNGRLWRVMRVCFASGIGMALLALGSWLLLAAGLPESGNGPIKLLRELALVGVPAAVGAGAYIFALHRFDIDEIRTLRRAILGKLSPRFAG
ncbi:MAG: murein biosynthesis integral membrane protein MurJ [Thermomicrobiales bacterium]